jgi:hypothetical protein
VFTLLCPDPALSFDTDTLKTAGIITGITIGVALVVILVAGTMRDFRRDRGEEEEDDEVWSRSPVLRTLGYNYLDDPLFGPSSTLAEDPSRQGLAEREDLEAFLRGRGEPTRPAELDGFRPRHMRPFRLGGLPRDLLPPDLEPLRDAAEPGAT